MLSRHVLTPPMVATILRRRTFISTTTAPPLLSNDAAFFVDPWPIRKRNTLLNRCPQGDVHVIERFGRFHRLQTPGLYALCPVMDKIAYRVNFLEKAIPISPQSAVTKDNVSVYMSGVVFFRFTDAQKAAYGHIHPVYAVVQHAQSAMRAAVGDMDLDQLFHDRNTVNQKITGAIGEAARNWGGEVLRYEVTEIRPDARILRAMDAQASAERERREKVIQADGDKRAAVLRSEGELIKRQNEAEARRIEIHKEAEAKAEAILMVATAMTSRGGREAAHVELARKYMDMMGEMGQRSNTIFFGEQPGDVTAMMARVATAFRVGGVVGGNGEGEEEEGVASPPSSGKRAALPASANHRGC